MTSLRLTPTPTPSPGGMGGIVPGLSDGLIGAVLGAITSWVVQVYSHRWGRGDQEKQALMDRLKKIDDTLVSINQALLKLEMRADEQDEYIEPIRTAMKDAIRQRFAEGS